MEKIVRLYEHRAERISVTADLPLNGHRAPVLKPDMDCFRGEKIGMEGACNEGRGSTVRSMI